MQTYLIAALLVAFGLAFRAKAALPTPNPADLETEAFDTISHLGSEPGAREISPGPDADR